MVIDSKGNNRGRAGLVYGIVVGAIVIASLAVVYSVSRGREASPAGAAASPSAPDADGAWHNAKAYLTINGGAFYGSDEYQGLWAKYVGDSGPVAEGAPLPAGTKEFEAALSDLQQKRAATLGGLAVQAGFQIATAAPYPGPLFDCVESAETTQCGDTIPAGASNLLVVSPPLEKAPDLAGKVTTRRSESGPPQRVLPYSSLLEFDQFRRSVLDDPAAQARLEKLRALITPDIAEELRVSPDLLTLNVSFVPDPGEAGL